MGFTTRGIKIYYRGGCRHPSPLPSGVGYGYGYGYGYVDKGIKG